MTPCKLVTWHVVGAGERNFRKAVSVAVPLLGTVMISYLATVPQVQMVFFTQNR